MRKWGGVKSQYRTPYAKLDSLLFVIGEIKDTGDVLNAFAYLIAQWGSTHRALRPRSPFSSTTVASRMTASSRLPPQSLHSLRRRPCARRCYPTALQSSCTGCAAARALADAAAAALPTVRTGRWHDFPAHPAAARALQGAGTSAPGQRAAGPERRGAFPADDTGGLHKKKSKKRSSLLLAYTQDPRERKLVAPDKSKPHLSVHLMRIRTY